MVKMICYPSIGMQKWSWLRRKEVLQGGELEKRRAFEKRKIALSSKKVLTRGRGGLVHYDEFGGMDAMARESLED